MRIAHFADTHIFNLKHHEELREVLNEIDKSLENFKPDIIVHAGDIVDNKVTLTPELFDIVEDFLLMLAKHCVVFIVPGNHDGLIHNTKRMLSLQPIVKALKNKNIVLAVNTKTFKFKNFCFHSLSIFDSKDSWDSLIIDESSVNVGVFHGTVGSVRTDSNFKMEGEVDLASFSRFDYLMLGHIHLEQQVDKDGKARYAGSTMQSGFDEGVNKGYLEWVIESKTKFSVQHKAFLNPKPFQTIQIQNANELIDGFDNFNLLNNCRLRVIVNDPNFSLKDEDNLKRFLKSNIGCSSSQFIKGAGAKRKDVEETIRAIELNNLDVQQSLILEHMVNVLDIKDEQLTKDVLQENARLFAEEDADEYVLKRNCSFSIKKISWSNFFSFGPDNEICFDAFPDNSIVGIFGENFSGKSSIIDVLCFVLWNEVTKDIQKNAEVMRFGTHDCSASVVFEHNGKEYVVERSLKKSKSGAVKSELEFYVVGEENKLEDKKKNTDKEITTFVGNMNDFLMTSFMSQFSGMMFVNEKSAARREVLKRILNLGVFDKRIEKLNKQIYYFDQKRKTEYKDGMDEEIANMQQQISSFDVELERKRELYKEIDAQVNEYQKFDLMVKAEQESLKRDSEIELSQVDLSLIVQNYFNKKEELCSNLLFVPPTKPRWMKLYKDKNEIITSIEKIVKSTADAGNERAKLIKQIQSIEKTIAGYEAKINEDIPCLEVKEDMVTQCSLAGYYISSKEMTRKNKEELDKLNDELNRINEEISGLSVSTEKELSLLNARLAAWNSFMAKNDTFNKVISNIETLKRSIDKIVVDYKLSVRRNKNFERNKQKRDRLLELEAQNKDNLVKFMDAKKHRDLVLNEGTLLRDRKSAMLERLKAVLEKDKSFRDDLYKTTILKTLQKVFVGNSGLTISIMKKFIPLINTQANEILSQMSDIVVTLEATEKDTLELTFVNGDGESRSVGASSGAERTMISIALRMALASITSLPVANLFILDEPATAFDEKRLEDFEKVFNVIKMRFEHVVLITHINTLKDFVDFVVRVEKTDGISQLVVEV